MVRWKDKNMSYVIVGLGNPGEEYAKTRHNSGRIILEAFRRAHALPDWKGKKGVLVSNGKIGKETILLMLPELFMNKSGVPLKSVITSAKKAEHLIAVYDDLDLPLGTFRISFGRSSGGHKGVESIIRSIRTKDFIRLRVGISPQTPSGKIKKPLGEKKTVDFLMGSFNPKEEKALQALSAKINEALEAIVVEGKVVAMNRFNQVVGSKK